ncbi:MAG TPA: PIG-L deacetylase family protein [Acidimicrobiales bacterium]|nr:PIG-L deacetylase family protein [Acidimicrobiales bacterium]
MSGPGPEGVPWPDVGAPARVLAVYAHPDDADVSCGGTLAVWAAAGADVRVVVCAAGDKGSSDPAVTPAALAERRTGEVRDAARALGLAGHDLLEWPDGELDNGPALRRQLVALVRRQRPDTVVCPDPTAVFFGSSYVNHRDHRVVGWATLDSVAHEAGRPHYFPDAGQPHQVAEVWLSGSLEPDTWVDIEPALDAKAEALRCHGSQVGEAGEWLRTFVEERAEEAGRRAGVRYAEGFRRLVLGSSA